MRISDVMNPKSARLGLNTSIQLAAEMLVLTQASDLAVVDNEGYFVGVLSEGDILRRVMPDFEEIIAAGGSLNDAFNAFIESGKHFVNQPVSQLVITQPITVEPDDELLKVAAVMMTKMIRRLPVVKNRKFLGTVSRADICWGLLCMDQGRQ